MLRRDIQSGLPYLAVGSGEPLVYLCARRQTIATETRPERTLTLRMINPLARAVSTIHQSMARNGAGDQPQRCQTAADAILDHFNTRSVLGASTGGSRPPTDRGPA
jgi:hypothetical protein